MLLFKSYCSKNILSKPLLQHFSTAKHSNHGYKKHFINESVEEIFVITREKPDIFSYLLNVFNQNKINLTHIEPKKLNIKAK